MASIINSKELRKMTSKDIAGYIFNTQSIEIQHWVSGAILDYKEGEMPLDEFKLLSGNEKLRHIENAIESSRKYEDIFHDITEFHLKYNLI